LRGLFVRLRSCAIFPLQLLGGFLKPGFAAAGTLHITPILGNDVAINFVASIAIWA
jgi:hypothetical protein